MIKDYAKVVIIIVTFIVADYWSILDIRLCLSAGKNSRETDQLLSN